ncbi:MAG: glycosyltransferase family 4 protein [Pedobacter sp.]
MELLLVSHKYPPATGGMEKQSFELIKGLSSLARVHTLIYEGKESRLSFFIKLSRRIKQMLLTHPGISIIHYNDGLMAAASLIHGGYKHLKRSVTFHGLDVVFPSCVFQKMIFPRFNNFDLVFAVSKATADACSARGIATEKIRVVNNGVDVSTRIAAKRADVNQELSTRYGLDFKEKRLLIAIGRPVKRKGFSWFIDQVMPLLDFDVVLLLIGPVQGRKPFSALLLERLPSFLKDKIELFLGSPSDETALQKQLTLPGKILKVIRTDKLPLIEMNRLLGVADAFVMPNIEVPGDMEGFGLVCLEACMQGANVFASATGGITDAIEDGKNGILLPPGDEKTWSAVLNSAFSNEAPAQLTADQIIEYTADHFSWKKMSEEYFEHFSRLANGD